MSLLPDNEQFNQLLAILHQGGTHAYWWINPGKTSIWWKVGTPPKPSTVAKNIYFGVHPTNGIPQIRHDKDGKPYQAKPAHVRALLHEVAAVNCLYGDFDAKDFGDDKAAALDHIEMGLAEVGVPAPSVIIDTGGGYQAYWLLDTPWLLTTDEAHAVADATQKQWIALIGADASVKDLSRVLRVVGSRNQKYDDKPLVTFLWADFHQRYTLAELQALLPTDEPPTPVAPVAMPSPILQTDHLRRWVDRRIEIASTGVLDATKGQGSNRRVDMGKLAGGVVHTGVYTEDQIVDKLMPHALQRSSDSERETERNLRNGMAYGKAAPLRVPVETFPTDQPLIISNGVAACPSCDTPVARSQYDYPGTTTPGWYCPSCKGVMKWPVEAYDPQSKTTEQTSSEQPAADPTKGSDTTRLTKSERVRAWLGAKGYALRLNMAGSILECNGKPLDDYLASEIKIQYADDDMKGIGLLEDIWRAEARRNAYHPIQDYLNSLVWDGKPHISPLAKYLACSDPDIVYDDKRTRSTIEIYLYRWLIGAVGKVFDRRQNAMLVLGGPEDIGKSSFARWLSSPLPDLHVEGQIQPNERDSLLRFATHWIWEVAEVDATTRRADRSALKGALTTEWITLRKAYGHFDTRAPAIASFIGTFNPDNAGFLDDPSGSRRFWVTTLTAIDWAYQQDIDINQVWAEAVAAYRAGKPWRLLPEETAHRVQLNANHELEDPMLDFLGRYLRFDADESCRMTCADIILLLRDKDVPLDSNARSAAITIGRALKKRGVLRRGDGVDRFYVGLMPL